MDNNKPVERIANRQELVEEDLAKRREAQQEKPVERIANFQELVEEDLAKRREAQQEKRKDYRRRQRVKKMTHRAIQKNNEAIMSTQEEPEKEAKAAKRRKLGNRSETNQNVGYYKEQVNQLIGTVDNLKNIQLQLTEELSKTKKELANTKEELFKQYEEVANKAKQLEELRQQIGKLESAVNAPKEGTRRPWQLPWWR